MVRLIIGISQGVQQILVMDSMRSLVLLKDNLKKIIRIQSEYMLKILFNSLIDEETSKMLQLV